MRTFHVLSFVLLLPALLFSLPVRGQNPDVQLQNETCEGPVYPSSELSRRAAILSKPEPTFTEEARARNVRGRVVVEAVLCQTGRITDLKVIEGLPFGMTGKALDAARRIKFIPAEKDGRPASQELRVEYYFNDIGDSLQLSPEQADGRLIESVEVMGNRRLEAEKILDWIQTRPGDIYKSEQVERDLEAILSHGYFDKAATRALTEEGARGGVSVVFEIKELPIISEVRFEGLRDIAKSEIYEAFEKEKIDVRGGARYEPSKVENARQVIKQLVASHGSGNVRVDIRVEQTTASTLVLTFIVSGEQ